ncbi:unnamed protein product [Rotaria sordida]|uniref:Uncharacterized protein n=1 Tax=Rotaria sordida TaxID=392033 RepID=A0A814IWI4_9BILA|nr:unnamed protein product [Rotaria sordida]CAF1159339.1 unnamed protein product [Rotaria sordida]
MENIDNEQQQQQQHQIEATEYSDVESSPDETINTKQLPPTTISLIQSLQLEENEEANKKKKKKKKKVKTLRQKELEHLTKVTKAIFASPEQLNTVCERINSLLLGHKTRLLAVCHSLDKLHSGRLPYEQFRLIIKDRLPEMSIEDFFVLIKLFEIEGLIDYRTILDEKLGNGILQHITKLSVPKPKEIVLEKSPKKFQQKFNESLQLNHIRYVTIHLRFITFDSYHGYPGHIHITVPDYISIYALSKMIIDKTDLATRSVRIFRENTRSRNTPLDPMHSLENYSYIGAYVDGTHNQSFPTYTLYYDYLPTNVQVDCPILKCDYYMK